MNFLGVVTGLPLWREALRGLGALLCNVIYSFISLLFQVFVTVAQANIFDEKTLAPIYQRITLILTIVMTFYITFEFIKYIVQPDAMGDKEKGVGNIAFKIVMVILLIAMVPKIFSFAYEAQGKIISQNVLGKIILGKTSDKDYTKIGYDFSYQMLEPFYKIGECRNVNRKCISTGRKYDYNIERIKTTGVVNILPGINDSENVDNTSLAETDSETPAIEFNGFMAIIVGGLVVYILVLYSVDLGLRYAQLLYLQVIAPIAIMGYLLPKKDGIFQKWTKQCLTTYLDVFIRLSVMYFAIVLLAIIGDNKTKMFAGIAGATPAIETLAYIAIVLGILLFVQKAPKLLQDLFGQSGVAGIGMGLGAKSRFEPAKKAISGTARTSGKIAGGVAGMAAGAYLGARQNGWKTKGKNRAWSAAKGAYKGAKGGFGKNGGLTKGVAAARESAAKDIDTIEAGGSPLGASMRGGHYSTKAKEQDIIAARNENVKKYRENTLATADEVKEVKRAKAHWESLKAGGATEEQIEAARKEYKAREKAAMQQKVITKIDATTGKEYRCIEYQIKDYDENGKVRLDASGKERILTKELRFDAEDEVRMGGVRDQIAKMVTNMKAEGTAENLSIKIKQADGTEKDVKVIDLMPKEDPPKKDDPEYDKKLKEYNAKCEEFINHMGEIATAAEEKAKEMKRSSEYLEAHANASNSGKK